MQHQLLQVPACSSTLIRVQLYEAAACSDCSAVSTPSMQQNALGAPLCVFSGYVSHAVTTCRAADCLQAARFLGSWG